MTTRTWPLCLVLCGLVFCGAAASGAGAQEMPDPSAIHGQAIPAGELADGVVTVRVVREAIGNNIAGQRVQVTAQGKTFSATTDELGRAEFRDLPRGAAARAETTVDGEVLASEPFGVPVSGGLRVILVSGMAAAAERRQQEEADGLAAPPVSGIVVFGGNTRIIAQFQSDVLRLYYQLDILNSARSRVDIGGPLLIDLPTGAAGATLRSGPESVTISGTRVAIPGPFAPGVTTVEISYQLPHTRSDVTVSQVWPAAMQQWIVGVQKVGNLSVSSPQFRTTEERAVEDGTVFVVANGPPMAAGTALTLQLSNVPAHGRTAAWAAIGLALALFAGGAWLAVTGGPGRAGGQPALIARRDALLAKLADLETSRHAGRVPDDRYLSRRQRLMGDLEQIYGELDETDERPHGGGVAA